jgi:hypothetical protein
MIKSDFEHEILRYVMASFYVCRQHMSTLMSYKVICMVTTAHGFEHVCMLCRIVGACTRLKCVSWNVELRRDVSRPFQDAQGEH